jgi:8-oxo-dGTP diphosphatase
MLPKFLNRYSKLRETRKIGAHRSPFLYRFDKQVYEEGLTSGVELVF